MYPTWGFSGKPAGHLGCGVLRYLCLSRNRGDFLSELVDGTVKRCVEHPIDCVQSFYGDPHRRRGHQNREYERNHGDALRRAV